MTNKIQKLPAPADGARVESGPVQFGEDWPGAFFRGDNAAFIAGLICGSISRFMSDGRLSRADFETYGFLLAHAKSFAACDLSGSVSAHVEAMQKKIEQAAALVDAPPAGGVQ